VKPIPSNPRYSITPDGEVRGGKYNKQLKIHVNNQGYKMVNLRRGVRYHLVAIHRLLLETFVGPCPEGMEAMHLDGNSLNNDLENLEWGPHFVNIQDSIRQGGRGLSLQDWRAIWIKILLATTNFTGREIARIVGVYELTVSNIKCGKTHSWLQRK